MTQTQLAEALGISQVAICAWEKGRASPKFKMIPRIVEVLKCPYEKLFEED